jgi:hypothetical protein
MAKDAAASTLYGPIDLLSLALRKAGLPMPDDQNVPGSKAWLQSKGLLHEAPVNAASAAGKTLGLLSPIVAQAKAPQISAGLLRMIDNANAPGAMNAATRNQAGAIVYHGSPHKFDKFDSTKIGTGEGAQAYGHGLYVAEAKKVADEYAGKLSKKVVSIDGFGKTDVERNILDRLSSRANSTQYSGGAQAALDDLRSISRFGSQEEKIAANAMLEKIGPFAMPTVKDSGNLYKIDLPDEHIAKMLDWDKPLSQQPQAIQDAVKPLLKDVFDVRGYKGGWGSLEPDADAIRDVFTKTGHPLGTYSAKDVDALNFSGSAIVKALGNMDSESAATAQLLRKQGLTGIRYLDGGSRGAGAGSSNFVVFPGNEGLLKILERNGVPINGK